MSLLRLSRGEDGHSRATGWATFVVSTCLWFCYSTTPAFAQPQGHGDGTRPGARPPVGGQPGGFGAGGRRPVTAKIPDEAPPVNIDRESLPPGYVPPREVPAYLKDCKEWVLNNNERPDTKKELPRFNGLKAAGAQLNGKEDIDLIKKVIRSMLADFTKKENREKVYKLREDIFVKVLGFPQLTQPVKDVILDVLVAEAPTLFDHCLEPRLNAVLLLSQLDKVQAITVPPQPAVPYIAACTPLLKLLNDPQQPDIVKIPAVIGVVRYAAPVNTNPDLKHKAVEALSKLLKNPKTDIWLQWRCAEGLGQIGYFKNLANQPVVLALLRDVMNDSKRHWEVRAQAARALGRLNLDPAVDLKGVAVDLASFALQMTVEYQKNPKQSHWQGCFFNLYLAFRPLDAEEKKKGWGLLTLVGRPPFAPHSAIVTSVYQHCLPLIQNVLTPPAAVTLPEAIKNLNDWLKQNSPNGGVNIAPAAEQPPKTKPPA
ncbi:MAG: HEAT repeat domain-containing protein [Planctomycetales bacterium]|nr:HEAT repeat domain-containing protein [Planctomycetales bacterium]